MQLVERLTSFFVAFDGKEFTTETECLAYERGNTARRLVGLTLEQVEAAIDRRDVGLADVIEALGSKIARARRDGGEKRFERKPKVEPAGEPERQLEPAGGAHAEA